MMDTQVDRELLEKIADLVGKPVGAFNIRKDCGCDGRQSTEHIKIDDRDRRQRRHRHPHRRTAPRARPCHIPVIITKSGVEETGLQRLLHRRGLRCGHRGRLRHPQLRRRRSPATTASTPSTWAKTPRCTTSEKHYGEGDGTGEQHHEPPDHRLSGGGRLHPDGDHPDPGRGLHQAVHQDRLRQGRPRPSSPSGC